MRRILLVFLAALLALAPLVVHASGPSIEFSAVWPEATGEGDDVLSLEGQADEALSSSSPLFIENVGQFADGARFQMRGGTGTVWLAEDAIWITVAEPSAVSRQLSADKLPLPESGEGWGEGDLPSPKIGRGVGGEGEPLKAVHLKLSFVGANPHPRLEPFARAETKVSYFIGADPEKWRVDVPVWGGVRYVDLYPGVDLVMGKDEGGRMKAEGPFHPSSFIPPPSSLPMTRSTPGYKST